MIPSGNQKLGSDLLLFYFRFVSFLRGLTSLADERYLNKTVGLSHKPWYAMNVVAITKAVRTTSDHDLKILVKILLHLFNPSYHIRLNWKQPFNFVNVGNQFDGAVTNVVIITCIYTELKTPLKCTIWSFLSKQIKT